MLAVPSAIWFTLPLRPPREVASRPWPGCFCSCCPPAAMTSWPNRRPGARPPASPGDVVPTISSGWRIPGKWRIASTLHLALTKGATRSWWRPSPRAGPRDVQKVQCFRSARYVAIRHHEKWHRHFGDRLWSSSATHAERIGRLFRLRCRRLRLGSAEWNTRRFR